MPYGNFVGYEPAEGGALDFSTRDGKKLRLVGGPAEELRRKLDASAFQAPAPANMTPVQPQPAPPPEYTPPNATALTGWIRNEPKPAPAPPAEPTHKEKQDKLMSWLRGDDKSDPVLSKTPQAPNESLPGKFQAFEAPQVRPGRTFARAATEAALDAAALPVVAASRAADYVTGRDSPMSHLSGKEAAESLEYLVSGTDPAQIRREEQFAEGEIPQAQAAGKLLGEYGGGAPLAALTGRVPAFGPVLNVISRGRKETPRVASKDLRAANVGSQNDDHAEQVREKLQRVFGGTVGPDDLHELTGVPGDSPVWPRYEQDYMKNASPGLHVKVPAIGDGKGGSDSMGEMNRYYRRDDSGKVIAEHELMRIAEGSRGGGIGSKILENQLQAYRKAGVDEIHTEAAWDGRYVWPKKGFELRDPADFPPIRKKFDAYLKRNGVDPNTVKAESVSQIANTEHGKGFLLSKSAPQMSLKLDVSARETARPFPKPGDIQISPRGMRDESLAYLRSGSEPFDALPVTITYFAGDPTPHVTDGRHRIQVARERGEENINGTVRYIGEDGEVLHESQGISIPIGAEKRTGGDK